jgi:hypothetical protein
MSYLDLAKRARARLLAAALHVEERVAWPANSVRQDETNELTKEVRPDPALALRAAYRRWFTLTVAEADGQRITPVEAETLHQQILRLTDDAGPLWADAVFADELRRFRWETARCGLCGGLGHDRDEGGPHA